MKKRKGILVGCICVAVIAIGAFFGAPLIATTIIKGKITANPENTFDSINVSWNGPQTVSGLHLVDSFGTANIDVVLHSSLISLLTTDSYEINVEGDVTIFTSKHTTEGVLATSESKQTTEEPSSSHAVPAITLHANIHTLTMQGDDSLVFTDIKLELSADPGRVCFLELTGTTDTGGTIACEGSAPDLLTKQGTLNWDSTASLAFTIKDAAIPTINGQGGWSIIEMTGDISSPKLSDAINVSMSGQFAEYGVPNGTLNIKTQFLSTTENNAFVFNGREIVGSIDIVDVPTTLLAPLLHKYDIDPVRDLGKTMEFHAQRSTKGPLLRTTFTSEKVQASGIVDYEHGVITDIELVVALHTEFIQAMTKNEFSGDTTATIHLDRLVPYGFSYDDAEECIGDIELVGALQHDSTNTTIRSFQSDFAVDLSDRRINVVGSAMLDEQETSFAIAQIATNKNKLHGITDLYETIIQQFPKGGGVVNVDKLPMSVLMSVTPQEQHSLLNLFGSTISVTVATVDDDLHVEAFSATGEAMGTVLLLENEFDSIQDAHLQLKLTKNAASALFGIPFNTTSIIHANIESLDVQGNSTFDATFDVGKQHTFVRGVTTRQAEGDRSGQLDAHVTATGIDTRLLDAIWNCNGLLADSLGSPIAMEIFATNILDTPVIVAAGTSPNAVFETSFGLLDGKLYTIPDVATIGELQLSSTLTRHLLHDLGPVLSDIRSVKHPIKMRVSRVHTSLDGDVSTLNADVFIDIGEVALDSGSLTMKLLPMFNTKHIEVIPAFFEPIQIEIRNGIATYKKFNLTLANKFVIPYSGTINFVTRELRLHSEVPLTGLGYSIKELRGLATDINVPILITGTIEHPVSKVDPNFDLSKILQSVAITVIGDAIGDMFEGDRGAPNPLDLLEDLLGGH